MKTKMTVRGANNTRLKACFDFLLVNEGKLTEGQFKFVKSLKAESKRNCLSDKQVQCLFDIEKSLQPNRLLLIHNYR
jgi:hypothetical protein